MKRYWVLFKNPGLPRKRQVRNRILAGLHTIVPLVLLWNCAPAEATNWYVDAAPTGTEDGRTWATAWTTFEAVDWVKIMPGDVIFVSGGTYGTPELPTDIRPNKGGQEGAPITIKASQENGHNGLVTIYGALNLREGWVTIDGAKDDEYAMGHVKCTMDVPMITNNINIHVIGHNAINFFGTNPHGMRVLWLDISSLVDTNEAYGVRINPSSSGTTRACEVGYCRIHDVGQDGITQVQGAKAEQWDNLVVHHCLIEETGDDGLEHQVGGLTLHDCILRNTRHVRGHPDGLQAGGRYYRIYNNIFYDWTSSHIITQGLTEEGGTYGPLQIYGNLFYTEDLFCFTTGIELKWYPNAQIAITNSVWQDWVFANNTMVDMGNGSFVFAKRDNLLTNAILSNIRIQNNIIANSRPYVGGVKGLGKGFLWNEADVIFEDNVISGEARTIEYGDRLYVDAEELNTATSYNRNSSTAPVFMDATNHDYRLAATDVVARDQGTDLSFLNLPGFDTDLYGTARGTGAGWDHGAIEFIPTQSSSNTASVTNGLALNLTFDDDFADGKIDDQSGNGRHAWHFGRPGNTTSNWPTRVPESSVPGRHTANTAGRFDWTEDGWGLYGKSGAYAGITNLGELAAMSEATILCWARYDRVYSNYTDYTADQNATILQAGTASGIKGTWGLGRWYGAKTVFYVLTNGAAYTYDRNIEFPDRAYTTKGDTEQWNHYAITFNHGTVVGFFNGQAFTNTQMAVTNLVVGSYPSASPWIGVGCNTHAGTPAMEDETGEDYPNHGWMNGVIDNVMVYRRALSPAEIQSVYAETHGDGRGLPAAAPPASPTRLRRAP